MHDDETCFQWSFVTSECCSVCEWQLSIFTEGIQTPAKRGDCNIGEEFYYRDFIKRADWGRKELVHFLKYSSDSYLQLLLDYGFIMQMEDQGQDYFEEYRTPLQELHGLFKPKITAVHFSFISFITLCKLYLAH